MASNLASRPPSVPRLLTAAALGAAVLAPSCARDAPATTTVTSATLADVRASSAAMGDYDPAQRMARELCRHEAACGRTEARRTDEAKLLAEQACIALKTPRVAAEVLRWPCAARTTARERYEMCLAAIRDEPCATKLDLADAIPACSAAAVCAPPP